jgi:type IV secretion system protein TrbC
MKKILNKTASFMFEHKGKIMFLFCLAVLSSVFAHASSTGDSLPWEGPLTTVKNSLTGPVALAVSVCALFACGAVLVFGGEMTEFVKRALYAVLAVSFIVGGSSFMTTVFGFSGAVISNLNTVAPHVLHIAGIVAVG